MKTTCRICASLHRQIDGVSAHPWDQVLLESDNFAAMPTLGAIVVGWMLVVPKDHLLCMGAVASDLQDELTAFSVEVRRSVEREFGATAVFEHGPAMPKLSVGCGVDHAHLHFVPTACDLRAEAISIFPGQILWRRVGSIRATSEWYRRNESYLFVEQPKGSCWIGTHADLPSQLFRKVIARSLGKLERFDWRLYPEVDNIAATVNGLSLRSSEILGPSFEDSNVRISAGQD